MSDAFLPCLNLDAVVGKIGASFTYESASTSHTFTRCTSTTFLFSDVMYASLATVNCTLYFLPIAPLRLTCSGSSRSRRPRSRSRCLRSGCPLNACSRGASRSGRTYHSHANPVLQDLLLLLPDVRVHRLQLLARRVPVLVAHSLLPPIQPPNRSDPPSLTSATARSTSAPRNCGTSP